jgi:anti-sigma B factor antagonist
VERGGGSDNLEIEISRADGACVVRLAGEFDLAGVEAFEEELGRRSVPGEETLVLDLRELTFIDSSGLRAVVMADRRIRDEGRRFVVVRGPKKIIRVLDLTGVSERLELVDRFPA